jgi:hypothetical protein
MQAFRETIKARLEVQQAAGQQAGEGEGESAEGLFVTLSQLGGDMKARGEGWTASCEGMQLKEVILQLLVSRWWA